MITQKYDVIDASTLSGLIATINSRTEVGWKIIGGVTVLQRTGSLLFFQAMYIEVHTYIQDE
jgi:hypothetical protein